MKKLNKSLALLLTVVLATVLASCSNSELVGKWINTQEPAPGVKIEIEFEFKNNGKMQQTVKTIIPEAGVNTTLILKGDYTFKDKTITCTLDPKDAKIEGFEVPGVSKEDMDMAIEQAKQQFTSKPITLTNVEFKDGHMKATFEGLSLDFKKK